MVSRKAVSLRIQVNQSTYQQDGRKDACALQSKGFVSSCLPIIRGEGFRGRRERKLRNSTFREPLVHDEAHACEKQDSSRNRGNRAGMKIILPHERGADHYDKASNEKAEADPSHSTGSSLRRSDFLTPLQHGVVTLLQKPPTEYKTQAEDHRPGSDKLTENLRIRSPRSVRDGRHLRDKQNRQRQICQQL